MMTPEKSLLIQKIILDTATAEDFFSTFTSVEELQTFFHDKSIGDMLKLFGITVSGSYTILFDISKELDYRYVIVINASKIINSISHYGEWLFQIRSVQRGQHPSQRTERQDSRRKGSSQRHGSWISEYFDRVW